jgi:hypothetical protein
MSYSTAVPGHVSQTARPILILRTRGLGVELLKTGRDCTAGLLEQRFGLPRFAPAIQLVHSRNVPLAGSIIDGDTTAVRLQQDGGTPIVTRAGFTNGTGS